MRADRKNVIVVIALISGIAALIYEISWIRPIQFVTGSTVYSLSIIFSSFMLGLSIGSFLATRMLERRRDAANLLVLVEISIAIYAVLLPSIINILPELYLYSVAFYGNFPLFNLLNYLTVFSVLLIPTTLIGMTWPLFVELCKEKGIASRIGKLYSANNLGAIIGTFITGFILIVALGIKNSILIGAILNLSSAFILIYFFSRRHKLLIPVSLLAIVLIAPFSSYDIQNFYEKGFFRAVISEGAPQFSQEIIFHKEGLHGTINVIEEGGAVRSLLINGKGQGGTAITDMRVNYLLAYLGLLLHDKPEKALVIGLGTGTTAGHLAAGTETTVVEIEPTILETVGYFDSVNRAVLDNPNIEIIINDGRNYLLKETARFDIIVPEPSDPWQDFSSMLFSKEFFELSSEHLNEGGIYVQWVPVYEMSVSDFKSFYATFESVFPNTLAFANVKKEERGGPYPSELIVIGSGKPLQIENIRNNFYLLDQESREMLTSIMLHRSIPKRFESEDAADRMSFLLVFSGEQMTGYAEGSEMITDDNMLLEFSTSRNFLRVDREGVMKDITGYLQNV